MHFYKLQKNFFSLRGASVKDFLQGIITNDIEVLTKKTPLYSLILTARGKFLCDFFLYLINNEEVLLEYSILHEEALNKILPLYNLHKKIVIKKVDHNSYISLQKPKEDFEITAKDPRSNNLGWKVVTKEDLQSSDIVFKDYELTRIKECIPDCSVDLVSGSSFPLEYNLDCAFSFTKGCYVGQEVTARFKLRNLLKRKIIVISSNSNIDKTKQDVYWQGKIVGRLLSRAKNFALCLIELEKIPKTNTKDILKIKSDSCELIFN